MIDSDPIESAESAAPNLIHRIDRWLAQNRPDYYSMLQAGLTDAQIEGVEQRLAIRFSPELLALYRWRNGQSSHCTSSLFQNRMFLSLEDAVETKEMLDDMIDSDFEDPKYWRRGWLPILTNGGGSYLCLDFKAEDGGHPGQLIAFWKHDGDRPVEYPNMTAWLAKIVHAMETGVYKEE